MYTVCTMYVCVASCYHVHVCDIHAHVHVCDIHAHVHVHCMQAFV